MATISQNIKRIRAKQGLTQDDLAKKANIKYSTLTNYLENETRQRDNLPQYKAAGLAVDSIPKLDSIFKDREEILRNYEKEIHPLSPILQKLHNNAFSLGVKVNN